MSKSLATEKLESIIKKNFLFQDLGILERQRLLKTMSRRTFQSGETIYHRGDRGLGVYIILRGEVLLRDSLHPLLKVGDFFGESAFFEEPSYRAESATAQQPTELVSFFKSDLQEFGSHSPSAAVKIYKRLGEALMQKLHLLEDHLKDSSSL